MARITPENKQKAFQILIDILHRHGPDPLHVRDIVAARKREKHPCAIPLSRGRITRLLSEMKRRGLVTPLYPPETKNALWQLTAKAYG